MLYRDPKCFFAVVSSIDLPAIPQSNKWRKDILYKIIGTLFLIIIF